MTVADLKSYKDGLYKSLSRDLEAFEKNFILISTGALTLSVTFIKDIVHISQAIWLPILFMAWGLIIISIGLMMFAFLLSVNGSNSLWKEVDDFLVTNGLFDPNASLIDSAAKDIKTRTNAILFKVKRRLKFLRTIAIGSFLIGIICFSMFVGGNLYRENKGTAIPKMPTVKSSLSD